MKSASYLLALACFVAAGTAGYWFWFGQGSTPSHQVTDARETPPHARLKAPTADRLAPSSSNSDSTPQSSSPAQPTEQTAMLPIPAKPSVPHQFGPVGPLQTGLAALSGKRLDEARLARDRLPADALDRHILNWAIALYGGASAPSADIASALRDLPTWPGNTTLQRNLERAIYREQLPPEAAERILSDAQPQTIEGAIMLARARLTAGDKDGARRVLAPVWRTETPELREELIVINEFGPVMSRDDHRARMETMFYEERSRPAERIAALAGSPDLAKAWSAVLRRAPDAGKLLEAVPAEQRGTGYLFALAKYQRQQNRNAESAATMLKAPSDASAIIDPDVWWNERRLVARRLLDARKFETAYRLVAAQSGGSPANAADAEFHAGWIALRYLKDAPTASKHFARLAEIGESPITKARAYYWMARAAEAGAPGKAAELYASAARYGTTFYGQLAAAKTGSSTLNLAMPAILAEDQQRFADREAVRAIDRLSQAGFPQYAARLYTELAQQVTSPGELALLAAKAGIAGNHFLALRVGKIATQRGIDVGALSHPVGAIPETAQISGAGKALAYAVARQESEFNVGAVSGAGALGLLQLMPETAKLTAQRIGLEYSAPRLTSDAGYNATLGAEELSRQLDRFSGSYVLTFIAYNAGPKRADQWIKRYGDPRGKQVDEVVDWIERVPFTETRGYIQRVIENYEVYKMRLSGKADLESDLTNGRQMTAR